MMIKIVIAALIIACIAPFFIKGPSGETIMTLDDWATELPTSMDEIISKAKSAANSELIALTPVESPADSPTKVYKWQDENGQWHFSSTAPDLNIAEEMEIGDVNLMEAYVPVPEPQKTQSSVPRLPASGMMTATPGQVQDMMETVTNLQETIDLRKADMDAIAAPAMSNSGK